MTDLSRKDFVRLLAAGIGSISTLFLTGFTNRNKLINTADASDKISQASTMPVSAPTDLSSAEVADPIIESTIECALEQFKAGYN